MRAFIAIPLPDDVKKELDLLQQDLKKANADVKWVASENIHLTLKFLGNVTNDKIGDIKNVLDSIASGYKRFNSSLFKIGAFPKLDFPKVIWVGIDECCAVIEEIASKIEDALAPLGFAKESRPFSAHVTLGRVRTIKNRGALKDIILSLDIRATSFSIDKIILFESRLTPQGPIYSPIHISYLSV